MALDKNDYKTGGLLMSNVNVTADTNSYAVRLDNKKLLGLDIFVDNNNLVGTISIQGCINDAVASPNWVVLTNIAVTSGVDVTDQVDLVDIGCKYVKVFFDWTSGNGLMTVAALAK